MMNPRITSYNVCYTKLLRIRESLTPEEKEMFLTGEQWPDSLFTKLDEFIIKE